MSWIDDRVAFHQLKTSFDQQFLRKRVADLHCRPLFPGIRAELGGGHCGAMDAVTPRLRPDIDDRVARTSGRRIEDSVGLRDPDAHRIDQVVAVVGMVEFALAAHGRYADAIAVAADAANDARHQVAGPRMIRAAKAQRIEDRDRPRAHCEDVT